MSATIIQIRDYQPKKTDAELREQAARILAMSFDSSMIGAEFGAGSMIHESSLGGGSGTGLIDTAPCEYVAPDKDPA